MTALIALLAFAFVLGLRTPKRLPLRWPLVVASFVVALGYTRLGLL